MPDGDKFQDFIKKDDTEYSVWQRSRHSSLSAVTPHTRQRATACYFSIKERKVCDTL